MIVSGHGLQDEGAAFTSRQCTEDVCHKAPTVRRIGTGTGGAGHGLCACGALSEHLESGGARERWHREHKAALAPQPKAKRRR